MSKFLKDTYSNNVPQFFEPVLELCAALIRAEGNSKGFKKKCSDHLAMERETRNEFQKHEDGHGSQHTQCIAFLSDLDILIDLLSHTDTAVCLDAAICFEALVSPRGKFDYNLGCMDCSCGSCRMMYSSSVLAL